ncbi:DNA-directed RNA polymerases I, II, and III subunit RPABC5 [Apostasia shenzhenica]|uniref:DNA-directed RNA polymerases I, II, and III subunit RPABC5 n=1 Tax=Apostasia shenzhenica TaxID=1088818 RepID=A0A2I0B534_9ASPA|nr:DNA-directed RNA polymerases I, II, and III subunit RPABC5 [Apostasia shenzhenica]
MDSFKAWSLRPSRVLDLSDGIRRLCVVLEIEFDIVSLQVIGNKDALDALGLARYCCRRMLMTQ